MLNKIAKGIRILTIPPIMVLALLLFLYFGKDNVFASVEQLVVAILCLMIAPILAYPISYIVPKLKARGRTAQRDLAIVLSFLGYTAGLTYAIFTHVNHYLFVVFLTYFLSIVMLVFFNSVLKIKASGHACSIAGPLTLVVYFLGTVHLVWCAVLFAIVVWSSLRLHRHSFWELISGGLTSVVAFFVSLLIA